MTLESDSSVDPVGLGLLDRLGEERVVPLPDVHRIDLRAVDDGRVVRLGEARAVVNEHHSVARDVDELVVLGLERADVEEAVLRELVQRDQPLSVGLLGLAHGGVVVAGLIVDVELLQDGVDLLALEGALREIDVPLADLAVEEERSVGVALPVIGGVQRTQTEFGLRHDRVARLDLVVEQVVELAHVEDGDRRRQLAVRDDVDAVRRRVDSMRAVRGRDVARVRRALAPIENWNAAHHLEPFRS